MAFYICGLAQQKAVSLKQLHLNYTALTDLLSALANLQSMTLYTSQTYQAI